MIKLLSILTLIVLVFTLNSCKKCMTCEAETFTVSSGVESPHTFIYKDKEICGEELQKILDNRVRVDVLTDPWGHKTSTYTVRTCK